MYDGDDEQSQIKLPTSLGCHHNHVHRIYTKLIYAKCVYIVCKFNVYKENCLFAIVDAMNIFYCK